MARKQTYYSANGLPEVATKELGSVPSPVLTVHTPERQPRRQGPAWPGDAEVRNQCYAGEEGLRNGADGLIKLSLEIDDVAE
ncbi:hypothetical protein V6000_007547 [Aspergillus fumigatus]